MDQELKQRLIGAAVITALAAIFVPMLFDDPIDESGKSINALKIPELPMPSGTQDKTQDVEIMPLPEKVEDVAAISPEPRPAVPVANKPVVEEGDDEAAMETSRPSRPQLTEKETATPAQPAKWVEPDEDVPAAEMEPAVTKPVVSAEKAKPAKAPVKAEPVKPTNTKPVPPAAVASSSTAAPASVPVAAEPVKPTTTEATTVRWYLNAGSFSQQANAVTLQETLKKQGFAASIKEVTGPKGSVFKVRVGPMLDKAKAQAVKTKLAQINVNSFLSGDE
jgi:DedD protein